MPEADPRFQQAIELFNSQQWYDAHDVFEELWHETAEPERRSLQGILQVLWPSCIFRGATGVEPPFIRRSTRKAAPARNTGSWSRSRQPLRRDPEAS